VAARARRPSTADHPNEGEFALGTVPLSTAFAKSCNTTFAKLASQLPPAALTDAAKAGHRCRTSSCGADHDHRVRPAADSVVQRAENGFGQEPW